VFNNEKSVLDMLLKEILYTGGYPRIKYSSIAIFLEKSVFF